MTEILEYAKRMWLNKIITGVEAELQLPEGFAISGSATLIVDDPVRWKERRRWIVVLSTNESGKMTVKSWEVKDAEA